jgi:hypothetical protein
LFNCLDGELSEHKKQTNTPSMLSSPAKTEREKRYKELRECPGEPTRLLFGGGRGGGGDAPLARKLNLSPLKLRRQHLETPPSLARPNPKQGAAPKALPCSLPAPTSSTPSVKGTAAWTATGGNEVSKLSDMAALSFENWLTAGAEGAASADAAAAACTSKNVARYSVDVKSACKRIDSGAAAAENADVAENAASAAAENGGGVDYAIQYEVTYSCRAAKSGPSPAAKRANASVAPSPALSAAPAAAAPAAAAPSYSGPVKVEATLRALVSQPPLREAADGSLVRPKPLAKETWFVEVRRGLVFSSAPLSARARSSPCFFSLPPTRALEASTSHPLQRNETNKKKKATTETSSVVEKTVKKSFGASSAAGAAGGAAPSAPKIVSTEEKEVAPVGSALAEAFGGVGGGGGGSSSSSMASAISSVGAALASALDAAAGADGHVGDALDAAVSDYRDAYYGGAPRGGAIVITSPVVGGVSGFNSGNALSFDGGDESAGGDFDGDESDFTSSRPAFSSSSSASTMSSASPSSTSTATMKTQMHESAAEEGRRVAREAASSAANALAAARPE